MEKEKYEKPTLAVVKLDEDIMLASSTVPPPCNGDTNSGPCGVGDQSTQP